MTIADNIKSKLTNTFSYGETLSLIIENNGTPISSLPNEDFVFEDNSVIRLTNTGAHVLQFLKD
jgi:hypothetical protein